MENKELLMRILDTYNDYAVCSGNLTEERVKFEHDGEVYEVFAEDMAEIKEIIERFERLEKYERVMIPSIRSVIDQLAEKEKQDKILEILKPYIGLSSDGIISCHNFTIIPIFVSKEHKERYGLLKEWLDNGKIKIHNDIR